MLNIFGKRNSDKRIVIWNLLIFIFTIYLTMCSKKINDVITQEKLLYSQTYSIFDNYRNFINSYKILRISHEYLIKYNYTYIPIFLLTFIWIMFFSNMKLKILKRYLIICSLYALYNSIETISTIYYKSYKYCDYNPNYYDIWGLFRCYTYKENFLLYSLIALYTLDRYHTSQFIRITFIILNFLNLYLSLVEKQIFLNQVISTLVISFLFWALYDNPYYFKNSKKNDMIKEKKNRKKIELEIQKSKLYEDVININDF